MKMKIDEPNSWINHLSSWKLWTLPVCMTVLLAMVTQYSFLAFHTLAELFTIIVSYAMFILAWSTRNFVRNSFLLLLASGYFWVGSLDLIHTLLYKGMYVFTEDNGNLGVQYWLVARYIETLVLIAAPIVVFREQNGFWLLSFFGSIAIVFTLLISSGNFPTGFVDDYGLTPFKVYSEYLIILGLALSLVSLFHFGKSIHSREKYITATAIILTICAELSFTLYIDVYGYQNFIGHIFKLFSSWLIFNAIVVANLEKPYIALQKIIKELDENKSQLEKRVLDRTNELEQEKVNAEAANMAKGVFLASMSHEIRTPMNGVLGMAELIKDTELNNQQKSYLDALILSGDTMMSVLNDILDYSKINSGKIELEFIEFDINHWLTAVVEPYRLTNSHNLEIKIDIDPELPAKLRGDVTRLQQIVNNLLGNAFKFTSQGYIELKAQKLRVCNERCEIQISITDTGIGIPEEKINNLFTPFAQAETSTTRKYGGSGLGLSICKSLVEVMGGKIGVDSVEGRGSSFSFSIFMEIVSDDGVSISAQHDAIQQDYSKLRVLLVDDNPINQMVAKGQLSKLGVNPVILSDGLDAFNLVCNEKRQFDIVFMDCEMPGMDGYEATRRIRQWEQSTNVPEVTIFALTAHVLEENTHKCLKAGMNGRLTKPIKIADYPPVLNMLID